jgi:hypothetical protein
MEQKYLKYKNKYMMLKEKNNQIGGDIIHTVPEQLQATQSWIYMPVILAPFNDISVSYDPTIDIILHQNDVPTINSIINKLRLFYVSNAVNLNDHHNLLFYNYHFDNPYHLVGDSQERLLEYAKINDELDDIIYFICDPINKISGKKIIIKKNSIENVRNDPSTNVSFFNKSYFDFINDKPIDIRFAEVSSTYIIPNKDKVSEYLMSNNVDVVIRDNNDIKYTNKNQVLIIFGAFIDGFKALYTFMKNFNGFIIYFIDKENLWFSKLMSAYLSIINEYTRSINNYIFYGGSMGGYGALHASVYFPDKKAICIATTPQTINYTYYHNKILVNRENNNRPIVNSTEYIYRNIPDILKDNHNYNTKIYTLIGKSECDDFATYNMDLFMDGLHTGAIINFKNVNTIIFNYATHVLAIKLNLIKIIQIAENNFDLLFTNQVEGSKLLNENINTR